ncbi:MAG: hypothetical protein ACYTKD_07130 [Planctomycetota bacterium]|jgi:hypothetical protein
MEYEHTQRSPLHLMLLACGAGSAILAWSVSDDRPAMLIALSVTLVLVAVAFCFATLTVRDTGTHLAVRFGPIPLFGTSIAYSDITEVAAARSSVLDGWGVHWTPGRGWIYNLWGFGCVRVGLGGKAVRIGTDDVEGLVRFLTSKLESAKPT